MKATRLSQLLPLIVLTAVTTAACSTSYQISGSTEIPSLDGKKLYLKALHGEGWTDVDSASVEHGLFVMDGIADSTMMVNLYIDDESIMPIILENGTISISISNSDITASGTPLNNSLYNFIRTRNNIEHRLNALDRREAQMILDGADINDVRNILTKEEENLSKEMDEYVDGFIKDNYNNILGPSVFLMMCSSLPYPIMTSRIESIMRTAPNTFKNNTLIKDFLEKAKENMKLIEEHQRLRDNVAEKQRAVINSLEKEN